MTCLNQVTLVGTVSDVSDIRYVKDRAYLNFDLLLANQRWTPKGETSEEKCVIPLTLYNNQARRFDSLLKPGRQVMITGKLTSRTATTAQGAEYLIVSVIIHTLQFTGE